MNATSHILIDTEYIDWVFQDKAEIENQKPPEVKKSKTGKDGKGGGKKKKKWPAIIRTTTGLIRFKQSRLVYLLLGSVFEQTVFYVSCCFIQSV